MSVLLADGLQTKMINLGDIYPDKENEISNSRKVSSAQMDDSVYGLQDIDELQNKLNKARDTKDFDKCRKVMSRIGQLSTKKPAVKVQRVSKFNPGDKVDVVDLEGVYPSGFNGLVGQIVSAHDFDNGNIRNHKHI